jgi:cell volume regulation protein A
MASEPHATEVVLLAVGLLLLASVAASRVSTRSGVPVVLLFLALGMLAGSEGIGRIHFEDYALGYRVGTLALVLILFDGGLRTPRSILRGAVGPAAVLATAGVAVTACVVGAAARLLGFTWMQGLLLGAIVAPTDAAAVFSVLRGGGVHLKERVGAVIELESGLNDPMAVLLTVALTTAIAHHEPLRATLPLLVVLQLAIGAGVGLALGFAARALLSRLHLRASGLYPVLTGGLACIAYGAASLASGSGFLAVYVAGVFLGNSRLPYQSALLRVHDFVAWASQIGMFLVLGLLVFPSRLLPVAPTGLAIALLLAFVARPIAVAVCVTPFGYRAREVALLGWVGLRGAVPIILAVIPILSNAAGAHTIFNAVFFVVIVSAVLQGGTAGWLTRKLGLGTREAPPPEAMLEIASMRPIDGELLSFSIAPAASVCGARLADIPFPDGASAMLVVRGVSLVAPKGDTVLAEGDHVYVFCRRDDAPLLRLLFGRPEEES